MDDAEFLAYVQAAALAVNLPLAIDAARRVASQLARTAALARLLDDLPLAPHDEPAEIFRPAPFPALAHPESRP